jgi:hypothetical protein
MIKKIFILSSILLFLAITFFGVYNFAFKDIERIKSLNTEKEEKSINTKTENYDNQNIKAITETPVIAPTIDKDGKKLRFYNKDNGNITEVDFDGSAERVIFENNISNLKSVKWSPDKNFVISSFENGSDNKFYLYSYITRKSLELKKGMDTVTWDNQGDKIIYKYFNEENKERSLNISDPNGKNWQNLVTLEGKFKRISMVQVPQTLFVSFWNYPDAFQETSLNKVNIVGDIAADNILEGKFGANYLWSPDGRSFLVSSVSKGGSNLKLEIGDVNGSNFKNLNVPTLVDKCVWTKDSQEIYCALPSDIVEDSVIPNDYQERKILTKDTFWKINIKSGKKERIVELEDFTEEYDAINLFFSPKENILFFINRYNDKVYRIIL